MTPHTSLYTPRQMARPRVRKGRRSITRVYSNFGTDGTENRPALLKRGPVFVELMPLLAGRTVLITVAKVDKGSLRVNVIPTQAKADETPALSTPLTCTGPPEELDSELGKHLAGYVQIHKQAASTLAEAKATLEAAAKAAQKAPDKGSPPVTGQPASAVPPATEGAVSQPPQVTLGLFPASAS
jgi:PRTRC genetic system protein E